MAYELMNEDGEGTYTTYGYRIPVGGHNVGAETAKVDEVDIPNSSIRYTFTGGANPRSCSFTFKRTYTTAALCVQGAETFAQWLYAQEGATLTDTLLNLCLEECSGITVSIDTSAAPIAVVDVSFKCSPDLLQIEEAEED